MAGRGEAVLSAWPLLAEFVGEIWEAASTVLSRSGEGVDKKPSSGSWPFISTSQTQVCFGNITEVDCGVKFKSETLESDEHVRLRNTLGAM